MYFFFYFVSQFIPELCRTRSCQTDGISRYIKVIILFPTLFFQALLDLESSASSDEAVRERIASLPPEVSEVSLLSKLEGKIKFIFLMIDLILYKI